VGPWSSLRWPSILWWPLPTAGGAAGWDRGLCAALLEQRRGGCRLAMARPVVRLGQVALVHPRGVACGASRSGAGLQQRFASVPVGADLRVFPARCSTPVSPPGSHGAVGRCIDYRCVAQSEVVLNQFLPPAQRALPCSRSGPALCRCQRGGLWASSLRSCWL